MAACVDVVARSERHNSALQLSPGLAKSVA